MATFSRALATTLLITLSLLSTLTIAQSTTSSASSSTSTATPQIFPGTSTYTYYGCYSETTSLNGSGGARALAGGSMEGLDGMTVQTCLSFCAGSAFAGLEYTRECWCAPYLSALSTKLPDSQCNLPCEGNSSQICGGALKLSVYQQKSATKGAGAKVRREANVGSILALGIAVGGLLCLA